MSSRDADSEGTVVAFISASFSEEADYIINWFLKIIRSLDITVIWLKEKYQARPVIEKIKENLELCNCFVQIITKDVYEEGKEAGWIGNEIAWAKDSTPMAIFVEKGLKATGLARQITDNLEFDSKKLHEDVPNIIRFLRDLKSRILRDCARATVNLVPVKTSNEKMNIPPPRDDTFPEDEITSEDYERILDARYWIEQPEIRKKLMELRTRRPLN